jgi:hypothetical protein
LPSGCGFRSRSNGARIAAPQVEQSPVPTLADECRVVSSVRMLDHAPRSPYEGSIAQSDNGIRELARLWPPVERLAEVMLAAIDHQEPNHGFWDTSMGFNAARTSKTISAGFLWCTISTAFDRRELAIAETHCIWKVDARKDECIARRYQIIFRDLGMTVRGAEAIGRVEFPDVLTQMNHSRLIAMGETVGYELSPDPGTPDQLVEAERVLNDPLARLAVGFLPGRGGGAPPGYKEARRLVNGGAVDALRRVLRGPNPEGRGFAAVGLSKLDALSRDDLRVIEQLKDTSTVTTQGGCMVTVGPAREFFASLTSLHHLFKSGNLP